MNEQFRPDLKAYVSVDDNGAVHNVLHTDERWQASEQSPRRAAIEYARRQAGLLDVQDVALDRLHEHVTYLDPRDEGASYRLADEKRLFDAVTVAFAQTYLNVPVWRRGISVTVKIAPSRIVECTNTTLAGVRAALPSQDTIKRWRTIFSDASGDPRAVSAAGEGAGELRVPASPGLAELRTALNVSAAVPSETGLGEARSAARADATKINGGRFYVYRYDPDARQPAQTGATRDDEHRHDAITIPLPPVAETIRPGADYVVAELLFTMAYGGMRELNWRALIELETGSVLYLRALVAGVNGLVFTYDPLTSTGVLTNTADQPSAVLNALRDDVALHNLDGPVGGTQSLSGSRVRLFDHEAPTFPPPTRPAGSDFDYDARTNEFAATNAYYHVDELFSLIEDLGFPLATYFDGTTFPIRVDHRACGGDGLEINGYCEGDAQGNGIGNVGYCLSDLSDTANPLGRAVDKWVHWHEICGHGILWDHVDDANFGFAHSAGDGMAALQNDPESLLRPLIQRFQYAPFRNPNRWMNRDVADGWGWGGSKDLGTAGYNSEQILATCHFRIYRSIGGDSTHVARRRFASRVMTYLILRAVGDLTPMTNPADALAWATRLIATDLLDWTSEGLAGGAYNKAIRWGFEKQGLYRAPGDAVTQPGRPPAVDVYIDDGRGGEYPFQQVHWANQSIWNRTSADGGAAHESAIEGQVNYAYVNVKNRGTSAAADVTVKGYHSLPGAGLTWPIDFTAMSPAAGLTLPSVAANSSGEVTFGPFEWTPNKNVYGHDCLLMIASVAGDLSNVDNFLPGETIEEWRLVPNDNNVGQRNVTIVPGGGGKKALVAALDRRVFYASNSFRTQARMTLDVVLPRPLRDAGWRLTFGGIAGDEFVLAAGERREIVLELVPGRDFTAVEVEAAEDRDIVVTLLGEGMAMGGMSYRLDPSLKTPPRSGAGNGKRDCRERAGDLLRCLDLPADGVCDVRVKKVSIEIDLDDGCGC